MILPRLVVITDWSLLDLEARVAQVATLGARVAIQHRWPGAPTRVFLERARVLKVLCDCTGARLFVNGRLDVALLVGAGLHVPEDSVPPTELRAQLPPGTPISVAVHDHTDPARANGADFALVSPVFPPGSKPDDSRPPLGREGFLRVAARLPCPAYALGGVTVENAGMPGAAGVAVISSVWRAEDPAAAADALLRALG